MWGLSQLHRAEMILRGKMASTISSLASSPAVFLTGYF